MSDSTLSISSHTLPIGPRSDSGRLILGLLSLAARELIATILVLIGASLLLFLVLKAAPSEDHLQLRLGQSTSVTAEQAGETFASETLAGQYVTWLEGVVTGDFGTSKALQRGRPVADLLKPAFFASFKLLAAGLFLSALLGLLAATLSIFRSRNPLWRITLGLTSLTSAIPVFLYVYALVAGGNRLIAWGAAQQHWQIPGWFPLPMSPDFVPWFFAVLILAVGDGSLMDMTQRFGSELRHSAGDEHMVGVRMMNISVPVVIARGFLPGALSHISRRISFVLGSLVVLEAALGWPGLGYLAWRAAAERDMPVLLGAALLMAVALRLVLMVFDLVGTAADPRRRVTK